MNIRVVHALRRADRHAFGALALAVIVIGGSARYTPPADQSAFAAPVVAARAVASAQRLTPTAAVYSPTATERAIKAALAERRCLADALYYEARGEGMEGQKAIAEVIFARKRSAGYPKSICGVVYEGAWRGHGCQFSFACNGAMYDRKNMGAWMRAKKLAGLIMAGDIRLGGLTGHATMFHAVNVDPDWASVLTPTVRIGNHIFYRNVPRRIETDTPVEDVADDSAVGDTAAETAPTPEPLAPQAAL